MTTTAAGARRTPLLLAVTVLVTVFTVAPMLLSVSAGLVNNYSTGLSSGLTTRWFLEVWEGYGDTVWRSLLLAAASSDISSDSTSPRASRPGVALVIGDCDAPDCCVPVSRGARSPASSGLGGAEGGVPVASTIST